MTLGTGDVSPPLVQRQRTAKAPLLVMIAASASLAGCGAKSGLVVPPVDADRPMDAPRDVGTLDTRADAPDAADAPIPLDAPALDAEDILSPLRPTGLDRDLVPVEFGVPDAHWEVSLSATGPFVPAVGSSHPSSASAGESAAIQHPTETPTMRNAFYRTHVRLPNAWDPARTVLEFDAGYDNWVVDETPARLDLSAADYPYPGRFFMRINGVWSRVLTGCNDAPFTGTEHYNTRCHVRISGGAFQRGDNVLEVWVLNFDGPYGLRIENTSTRGGP